MRRFAPFLALLALGGCGSEPTPEVGSNGEAESVVRARSEDPALQARANQKAALAGGARSNGVSRN